MGNQNSQTDEIYVIQEKINNIETKINTDNHNMRDSMNKINNDITQTNIIKNESLEK